MQSLQEEEAREPRLEEPEGQRDWLLVWPQLVQELVQQMDL